MKLNKLIASLSAAAVAAAAMGVSASAVLKVVPQDGHFRSGTGSWMPVIYSDQTFDASEKDYTDYGIDCTKIATIEVTITTDDPDFFDGSFGGAIVLSSKGEGHSEHNWNGKEYWGTQDEEREIDTLATDKPVQFVKTGDLTYTGTLTVDDSNCVFEGYQLVQVAVQEWGQDMSNIVVKSMVLKDADGNVMISFDENGKASLPLVEAGAAADDAAADDAATDEDAAADDAADEDVAADDAADEDVAADDAADEDVAADDAADEDVAADDAADEDADADDAADEAPVVDEAPAADETPAAGDVAAATDSTKGSPDTGVADVAAVAGLGIVAAGAVLVAKKRK